MDFPAEQMEVILIDNGSTDRTREIARQFGAVLLRDDNLNVSGLRNLGARHARGSVLAFLDADCIVEQDWLAKASRYFTTQKVSAWGSPPVPPENSSWVQKSWYQVRKKDQGVQSVQWLESMNFFVRKELYQKIGGFNEKLVTCEDVDLLYRLGKFGDIVSDDRIKVTHLGEAKDLKEFMHKEIWRGQGNLKGVFSHGLSIKELPSIALPVYFIGLIFAAVILLVLNYKTELLFILVGFAILPSLLVLFQKRRKISGFKEFAQLFFLLQIYFGSRTLALFKKGR